jgi:hypothetical protein
MANVDYNAGDVSGGNVVKREVYYPLSPTFFVKNDTSFNNQPVRVAQVA